MINNYKQILEAVNKGIRFALDDFDDNEEIQGLTVKLIIQVILLII